MPPPGNNHVHMRVVRHRRAPGVKHGGDADAGAEVPGIGGDGQHSAAQLKVSYHGNWKRVTFTPAVDTRETISMVLVQCGTPRPQVGPKDVVVEVPVRSFATTNPSLLGASVMLGVVVAEGLKQTAAPRALSANGLSTSTAGRRIHYCHGGKSTAASLPASSVDPLLIEGAEPPSGRRRAGRRSGH